MIYVLFLINFDHYTFYTFVSASADFDKLVELHHGIENNPYPLYGYDLHVQECDGYRGRTHYVIYAIEDGKRWEGCLG